MLRDELNDQDAKDERGQSVERVVAVDEALLEGYGGRGVGFGRRAGRTGRRDQRFDDEDNDRRQ